MYEIINNNKLSIKFTKSDQKRPKGKIFSIIFLTEKCNYVNFASIQNHFFIDKKGRRERGQ